MQTKNVIIIGSGIAGLATAIRLACGGYTVKVFERNGYPGGKLSEFEQEGFHFDAGPSLFTQPRHLEELFELAGEPIEKYFTYIPVEIACRYFYENGTVLNAYTRADAFAREVSEKTTESPGHIIDYLERSRTNYENIGTVFLNHSLQKRSTWLNKRIWKALGAVRFSYLFSTLDHYNRKQFSSPELIQLFNRYATYNGSNPFKAPAMLSLIPHLEQNLGTFYPKGGMISITRALYDLALAKGVQFYLNSPVERIIQHEGKVLGIVVNQENQFADMVISNADIYFTYRNLLRDEPRANKLLKQERSSSALIFYWGISKSFPQLQLHNIFFSKDYKKEFDDIFIKKQLGADPTIYINITSKMEDGLAPSGKENWFVMVNAPANAGQDWDKLKVKLRANIIDKLNRILGTQLEELIETERINDPVTLEAQTGSYMGSLYGTSSNSKLAAFFRPANFTTAIKGLYFCGGSVHPGGGIPLCLKSAMIVSDLIQQKDKH